MALFNRQKNDIPPELQPYYDVPNVPTHGSMRLIIRVILMVVTLVLLVLLVRWAWHEAHTSTKPSTTKITTSQSQKKQSAGPGSSSPATAGSPSNNSTTQSTPSNTTQQATTNNSASSTTSPAQPTTTNLSNTGPGDVFALFGVATIAGVAAYQVRIRKNASY